MADPTRARRGTADAPRRTVRRKPPPLDPRCALFLDVDGTLLDLAPAPDRVQADAGLADMLSLLSRKLGGAVALISGRAIADVDRLFPGLRPPIAGQHGLERRRADGSVRRHRLALQGIDRLRRELARFAARHEGLLLEDKGASLALHYRLAPRLASHVHRTLRAQLAAAVAPEGGWRLQPGKRVLEVTPDGRDKGAAVREFLLEPPFAGRIPVFVGDDRTDEFGFAAAAVGGGWGVKVGPGPTCARHRLRDVAAVRRWLSGLVPTAAITDAGRKVAKSGPRR